MYKSNAKSRLSHFEQGTGLPLLSIAMVDSKYRKQVCAQPTYFLSRKSLVGDGKPTRVAEVAIFNSQTFRLWVRVDHKTQIFS